MKISARLEKSERVQQELQAARAEQQRLANAPEELARLRGAQTDAEEAVRQAEAARATIARRESQIAKADGTIARIRQETAALPELTQNLSRVETDLAAVRLQAQTTQREIGNRPLNWSASWPEGRSAPGAPRQCRPPRANKQIYSELQAAFGKKGVRRLSSRTPYPKSRTARTKRWAA
jgi:hypothetical protein